MQLYAKDLGGSVVSALQALKQVDYYCRECGDVVRLRKGGCYRRDHFFHRSYNRRCRLNGKSLVHLQVQHFLQKCLPDGESEIERRFPEIDRIADIVWEKERIVFEVQCSAIDSSEVEARNFDYRSQGYDVVWIFHDTRYNQDRMNEAEKGAAGKPWYFTDIDEEGKGIIYDQVEGLGRDGLRQVMGGRLPIKPNEPRRLEVTNGKGLYFAGDATDLSLQDAPYGASIVEFLRSLEPGPPSLFARAEEVVRHWVVRPYLLLFQVILEKFCR